VKDWNALPHSVVSAGSLALFKSRLTSHVAPCTACRCDAPVRGPANGLTIQIQIQRVDFDF